MTIFDSGGFKTTKYFKISPKNKLNRKVTYKLLKVSASFYIYIFSLISAREIYRLMVLSADLTTLWSLRGERKPHRDAVGQDVEVEGPHQLLVDDVSPERSQEMQAVLGLL